MKKILRKFFYALPPQYRFAARRLVYWPIDFFERCFTDKDPMIPPRGLIYTGSGDFKKQGDDALKIFIQQGGLKPKHRVLDVGSGIGRMARPLTGYLNPALGGTYHGFDAVKLGVDWCQKRISARFPHFVFQYIPLENDLYRADGQKAATFRFPYADRQFDFTFLTSIFTHFQPEETANYLKEIHRTLDTEGVCLATFFILNDASRHLSANNPDFQFPFDYGHFALMDDTVKAANVAYDEVFLEKMVMEAGLTIQSRHYGFWSGRPAAECLNFQDIVVMRRQD